MDPGLLDGGRTVRESGEVYVNHLDAEEATRIRAAYAGGNYDRLVAPQKQIRPDELCFGLVNQNIKPTV